MNYNCHKLGGITSTGIITYYAHYHNLFTQQDLSLNQLNLSDDILEILSYFILISLIFISSYIVSTLPDIDHPYSIHGKNHRKLSQFLNKHGGHRGWTHYPCTLMCFGGVFYGIYCFIPLNNPIKPLLCWSFIGILGGWASHIFLDLFNKAGVPLLMPFSKVRVKIPSGITLKNKNIQWRCLRGGNVLDDFLLVLICFSIFILSVLLINPQIITIITTVL